MMEFLMLAQEQAAEAASDGGGFSYADVLFVKCGGIGYVLWLISLVVVALCIRYFLSIRRLTILPNLVYDQVRQLLSEKQYREAFDVTESQPDFLSHVLNSALSEAPHGYSAMERAMEEASEEQTTKMLRSIEWLNLIGNIGPMLGLLGTVWGMIGAFFTIVKTSSGGQAPNPADLAGDIGVALVTTLLGLSVSIPALSVYAVMRNRIDALTSEAMLSAQELISQFRPVPKRQG